MSDTSPTYRETFDDRPWLRTIAAAKAEERLLLARPHARFGAVIAPESVVRDVRSLADDADHWKAEALKWQAIAEKLTEAVSS